VVGPDDTVAGADGPVALADVDATLALGARIVARLDPGDVVLLRGDLGAGKTTLVRGAATALGGVGRVTSPTFALAHRYDGRDGVRIAHLDLYRLGALGDDDADLLDDELDGATVAFVEWPDVALDLLDDRVRVEVDLSHADDDTRRAVVRWR